VAPCIALTRRGISAAQVIGDAVGEIEPGREEQLGPKRFAVLRSLLQELGELAQP
jgi:hypothetical protein